jgi:hypothetical protein
MLLRTYFIYSLASMQIDALVVTILSPSLLQMLDEPLHGVFECPFLGSFDCRVVLCADI